MLCCHKPKLFELLLFFLPCSEYTEHRSLHQILLRIRIEGHEDLEASEGCGKDDTKWEKLDKINKLEAQITIVNSQFTEEWPSYSSFAPEHN